MICDNLPHSSGGTLRYDRIYKWIIAAWLNLCWILKIFTVILLQQAEEDICFLLTLKKEVDMDKMELKKLLAGLSIASLIAGTSLAMTGCATGWSADKAGAGGTDTEQSEAKKEAPAKRPAGKSGWG